MPDQTHDRWLGMAALAAAGVLPADEAGEFAEHLASCRRCEAELAQLRPLAAALNEVPIGDQVADPPETLREGVVWAVRGVRRSEGRRRRFATSIAAAAAAIAFIGVGMAIPPPSGPPQEALAVTTTSDTVDAEAALVAHTWGTELKLVVEGLDAGERYSVTFIDRDGGRVPAGTFIGVDDRPIVCDMNAAVMRPDARRFEVASADGVVLAADLPAAAE